MAVNTGAQEAGLPSLSPQTPPMVSVKVTLKTDRRKYKHKVTGAYAAHTGVLTVPLKCMGWGGHGPAAGLRQMGGQWLALVPTAAAASTQLRGSFVAAQGWAVCDRKKRAMEIRKGRERRREGGRERENLKRRKRIRMEENDGRKEGKEGEREGGRKRKSTDTVLWVKLPLATTDHPPHEYRF